MIFEIAVAFIVLAIGYFIKICTRNYGVLEAMGIPVAKPFLCFGSGPFALHKIDVGQYDKDQVKQFSPNKTWGRYEGSLASVYTVDIDLMKEVFVKKFEHFGDRAEIPLDDEFRTLDILDGETWKYVRKSLSPVFTSGKLKGMVAPINQVVDRLMAHLNHQSNLADGNVFQIEAKPMYQATTMEAIMRIAFGIEGDFVQREKIDTESQLYKKAVESMSIAPSSTIEDCFWNLFQLVPALTQLVLGQFIASIKVINAMTQNVMNVREKSQEEKAGDFIDKLVEMAKEVRQSEGGQLHGANESLVVAQGGIFLLAGFETTANTLGSLTYMLAKHPDIQQRIYEEICEHVSEAEKINYETVDNFKYMHATIQENLRLFPPVPRNQRRCSSDVTINGMTFKKGTQVIIPVHALHTMKEYWGEDAEEFNPDRFFNGEVDANGLQFHTFGGGPRLCIGMRFAFTEMKMILGRLLFNFEILPDPDFEFKLNKGGFFLTSFDRVSVKMKKRNV